MLAPNIDCFRFSLFFWQNTHALITFECGDTSRRIGAPVTSSRENETTRWPEGWILRLELLWQFAEQTKHQPSTHSPPVFSTPDAAWSFFFRLITKRAPRCAKWPFGHSRSHQFSNKYLSRPQPRRKSVALFFSTTSFPLLSDRTRVQLHRARFPEAAICIVSRLHLWNVLSFGAITTSHSIRTHPFLRQFCNEQTKQ